MTSEERKKAEIYALQKYGDEIWFEATGTYERASYCTGWVDGRESMRAEHGKFCEQAQERTDADFSVVREACEKARDESKAEHERSQKLIEALKETSCQSDAYMIHFLIDEAIAEYEASP